jgi:hypothetical protein
MIWNAFVDDTKEKTADLSKMKAVIDKARQVIAKNPNLVKYPAVGTAGVLGWKGLERAKRRYDIGTAYEEAQGQ